jgi:CheY-like chemotaxis protein
VVRVLVVEDDAWRAWMIADDLAERGYAVSTARDGAEALRRLAAARPDAIVLDLMLPKMHAWDFVERYQERTGGSRDPHRGRLGGAGRAQIARGQRVRHFLPKPFDVEQLARSVADALASPDASGSAPTAAPGRITAAPMAAAASRAERRRTPRPGADRRSQRSTQPTPSPTEVSGRG